RPLRTRRDRQTNTGYCLHYVGRTGPLLRQGLKGCFVSRDCHNISRRLTSADRHAERRKRNGFLYVVVTLSSICRPTKSFNLC
ncbi:hypothetical protein J6590_104480, partial [Homalodisca vitripennis]